MVECLIDLGGLVNPTATGSCRSPLHHAASKSHYDVCEYLIGKGAGVNARDWDGCTPLHVAVKQPDNNKVVTLLLRSFADSEAVSNDGYTVIHYSVYSDSISTLSLLLEVGNTASLINAVNKDGASPLHLCVMESCSREFTRLLIGKGGNVHQRDAKGVTPLFYAAKTGNIPLANVLLQHGASEAMVDTRRGGRSGLDVATLYKHKHFISAWGSMTESAKRFRDFQDLELVLHYASLSPPLYFAAPAGETGAVAGTVTGERGYCSSEEEPLLLVQAAEALNDVPEIWSVVLGLLYVMDS